MNAPITIYALASAAGKSGVAVFRVSGAEAQNALVFLGVEKPLTPRYATLVTLRHDGRPLDQALALYFTAPHSFTGEDVLELHTHGSRAVTRQLLDALAKCPGLRMAEPGEFARRAFLSGKLDLAQAEGLADLIDAESRAQHAQAIRQLGGTTSERVEALRQSILEPLALLEAYIDFPDEEIPESVLSEMSRRVATLKSELTHLLDDNGIGEKIREGIEIVILGPPNAGKSTLLNALAKRDAAIVSPEAGTTRDLIEVTLEIGGQAVTLIDTAGLRKTENTIEAEGIRRTRERARLADLKLYLHDTVTITECYNDVAPELDNNTLLVLTKSDLENAPDLPVKTLPISVKTGAGMDQFIAALTEAVATRMESHTPPLITRARHRVALVEALSHLTRFDPRSSPLELLCEELRLTARSIGKITGKIAVDDVLDVVFSRFCIGK